MGKIIVIGSSNTDMVFRSKKIPVVGETVIGIDFNIVQGGKGANQAVAAARAGADVTFIALLGNDEFGKTALKSYENENINTKHIIIDQEYPTGVAVILVDATSGQNSIVVAPGANHKFTIKDIQDLSEVIKTAEIMLIQLEIPLEVVHYSLKLAKKFGLKTILNPAPAQCLSDDLLKLVDIITPNETETEILTNIPLTDFSSIKESSFLLLKKVNEAVLITMGSKGVYYASKNGDHRLIPTTKVEPIDTTAAGDVFNGYLAAALSKGSNIEVAIELANKAAAISVTRKGAQPSIPYLNELYSNH